MASLYSFLLIFCEHLTILSLSDILNIIQTFIFVENLVQIIRHFRYDNATQFILIVEEAS